MAKRQTAAALIIGSELLSGKIGDENLAALAATLSSLGIKLARAVFVPDERATIAAEVRALSGQYDLVFTSGGVGPTHDDLTIDSVADAFDVPVAHAPELEAMLRDYYGGATTEAHLRMARAPLGSRLVTTAVMPWPTVVMRNVWVLPGVPQIFSMKMRVLRAELGGAPAFVSRAVCTTLDEGHLKPFLDRVVAEHPLVEVGSYPKWNEPRFKTMVTFDGAGEAEVDRAKTAFEALLPEGSVVADDERRRRADRPDTA